jgi:hypothetical protein
MHEGESKKKRAKQCVDSLLKKKLNFEKLPLEHYISKNCFIYEINSYIFKTATAKFSGKFNMFQEFFYMFKTFKKSMWTSGFCIKSPFPLSNVHQIGSIFL